MGAALSASNPGALPHEDVLVAQLIQILGQRPQNTLLLLDLEALLDARLRQQAKENGGLSAWLKRYSSHFLVAGPAGQERVSLSQFAIQPVRTDHAAEGTRTPPRLSREDIITPVKSAMGGLANAGCTDDQVCPGADVGGKGSFDELMDEQSALQMRGLPYRATVADIRNFLAEHASNLVEENPIHLVLNRDGRPSGFARVQFDSPEAARACRDATHLRSMEDRYVEVFLYSDRPRVRNRPVSKDNECTPVKEPAASDCAVSREQVIRECREVMADPNDPTHGRRMLLSMLGVELSPGARSKVKQMDNGLKHLLAQHPDEFAVVGSKGCEHVTYTPSPPRNYPLFHEPPKEIMPIQLSEVLPLPSPPAVVEQPFEAPPPLSPKPTRGAKHPQPTPKSGMVPPTPSDFGYPNETPSRWQSPAVDPTLWPPHGVGQLPPWPPASVATGLAGMPPPVPGSSDNNAAIVAMASAFAAMAAAPWAAQPSLGPTAPALFPGFPGMLPTAQAPWGASLADMAAQMGAAQMGAAQMGAAQMGAAQMVQPGDPATASKADTAGDSQQGQACKVWPGQASPADNKAPLGSAVRLRGLPFSSSEQDVLAFFAQHDIVDRICDGPKAVSLLLRANGRPSGQAVVQMRDRGDAAIAQRILDGKWMGSRYIEVFLHGEEQMEGGASSGSVGAASTVPQCASTPAAQVPPLPGSAAPTMPAAFEGQTMPSQMPPFEAMPQWPAAWGAMAAMSGDAALPAPAAVPPMPADWTGLFESLGAAPDASAMQGFTLPMAPLGMPSDPSATAGLTVTGAAM